MIFELTNLEPIDYLSGFFSFITVLTGTIVGLKIIKKYFKFKNTSFIYLGLSWIGMYVPWHPSTIAFFLILITGKGLDPSIYIIIGNVILPIFANIWLMGITEMITGKKQKFIIIIYSIIGILFEIYLFYFLVNDISVIGEFRGSVDIQYKSFFLAYLIFLLLTVVITGILFAREPLKSENLERRLQGKFLTTAFLCYLIGAFIDAAIPLTAITLIFARIVLILSPILFYFGLLLPDFVKKRFLREK